MTPSEYKTLRQKLGTQQQVADLLGVHKITVAKREGGALPISRESALALENLAARGARPTLRKRPA
jgi:DNA-binding transcriptional regulator YdaS (Cro superfamily)